MAGARITLTAALLMVSTVISDISAPVHQNCANFQTSGFFRDNNLQVQFLLFTSRNPRCPELIPINETFSFENSTFKADLDTKVIVHGFRALGTKPSWIDDMVESLLAGGPVNVVAVDWVNGATAKYNQAVENVPRLSREVVALINRFLDLGSKEESFHLIGVSLGAHVAGYVGHYFGGRIGRITGLDPAGYKFTHAGPEQRLDPSDAMFVEAVHTDTDSFGIRIHVGHVDYFINGGRDQPGCPSIRNPYRYLICDHMRSVTMFINALRGICSYVGFPCSSYQMFRDGHCADCQMSAISSCPQIGMKNLPVPGDIVHSTSTSAVDTSTSAEYPRGPQISAFMLTTSTEPYCAHHILLDFRLVEAKDQDLKLKVQLISADTGPSSTALTVPQLALVGRALAALGAPLCRVVAVVLRTSSSWNLLRRKKTFRGRLCLTELPLGDGQERICLPQELTFSSGDHQTHNLAQNRSRRCQ